jgi:hypothetical protein
MHNIKSKNISLVSELGLISLITGVQINIKICKIENNKDSKNPNKIIFGFDFNIDKAFFTLIRTSRTSLYIDFK